MSETKHYIFKTLDNPPRILYWDMGEFLIMIMPIFLGACFGSFLMMFGAFLKIPYSKIRKRYSHRHISHFTYWNFPTETLQKMGHFKKMPQSNCREYLL